MIRGRSQAVCDHLTAVSTYYVWLNNGNILYGYKSKVNILVKPCLLLGSETIIHFHTSHHQISSSFPQLKLVSKIYSLPGIKKIQTGRHCTMICKYKLSVWVWELGYYTMFAPSLYIRLIPT